ncbi:MAG TPA: marine proteobacterial sortase target protein [Candidatus Angelobacter sp.]|nr:marine proteobacterial sortase target protein [Candidatus Angelobacter sp.]
MARIAKIWFKRNEICVPLALALLAVLALLSGSSFGQQTSSGPPQVGEGSLIYRSPNSNQYQTVPLVHTDAALDVRGLVASATVTQQYVNSSTQPIEAIYIFPLPHDAAVYDMEIRVGNRVIRSVVKEREEAKKTYEAAKSQGKRAALLEQERPNIFTASVANIMPGDKVDVCMRYVEPLTWEDGKVRLVFPMVVGPRYIPGTEAMGHSGTGWSYDTERVADASRITPPVANPATRAGQDISVSVDVDTGSNPAIIYSVSHAIQVSRLPDGRQHVELSGGKTIPNKDFVLEVQRSESSKPQTALFLSPDKKSGETHLLLAAYPPTVRPTQHIPVEMLYMIDVSGSMEGTSIQQARGALLQALDQLQPGDRFGILAFSSGYQEFSPEPLAATNDNLAAARRYVKSLEAGGGTEMLPALEHLMQKPQLPGYLRHIVLLTDGDLGNEEEIFAALRSQLGNARLYTVAIGSEPNTFLATKMAQFGRGTFTHIADINEVQQQMSRLFENIESPVLTDVKLSFEGVQVEDVYPSQPPDLFMRQPLLIYGHIITGHKGKIHLTAHAGSRPYETTIAFDTSKASFHPGITTLWARQRVEEMMDKWRESDQKGQADIRAGIIAHAIRYHLVTRFTSLVAVEEVVVNATGQSNTAAVPTELPSGWQMDKVFGAPATGTADEFLETLGFTLLLAGAVLWLLTRRVRTEAIS